MLHTFLCISYVCNPYFTFVISVRMLYAYTSMHIHTLMKQVIHIYSFLILFCFLGCMFFILGTPKNKIFYFCLLILLIVITIKPLFYTEILIS